MKKVNDQNAMIKMAVQEDVALNIALKGLLDLDTLLSESTLKPTTINKKRPFIQFLIKNSALFGIF